MHSSLRGQYKNEYNLYNVCETPSATQMQRRLRISNYGSALSAFTEAPGRLHVTSRANEKCCQRFFIFVDCPGDKLYDTIASVFIRCQVECHNSKVSLTYLCKRVCMHPSGPGPQQSASAPFLTRI